MVDDNICGAKNRKGEVCRHKPMKNGRCRFHGGKSTGAPKGSQNAKKHGAYARFFTDAEKQQLEQIELGSLKSELQLCKIQLIRALEAQAKQLTVSENDKLELVSQTIQAVKDEQQISRQQVNKAFSKTDFGGIIDRLMGRIQSLTHSLQDMQIKAIDLEIKQIELKKIQDETSDTDNEITINIVRVGKDAV